MKLTRKQLRRLIEMSKIKPSLGGLGLDPYSQQKLQGLASSRSEDYMGRKYADEAFDDLISNLTGDDVRFSQREFKYDYPLVEDPDFEKELTDLFYVFMYENKGFANDVYDLELEDYQEMVRDEFIDQLPETVARRSKKNMVGPALSHTFSRGKIPYQLEEIIRKMTDPISAKAYRDQLEALPSFP